jgi:hypothetical protein
MIVMRHGGGAIVNNANPRMKALLLRSGAFQKFVQGREESTGSIPLGNKKFWVNDDLKTIMDKIIEIGENYKIRTESDYIDDDNDERVYNIMFYFWKLLSTCDEIKPYHCQIKEIMAEHVIGNSEVDKWEWDKLYDECGDYFDTWHTLNDIPMRHYSDEIYTYIDKYITDNTTDIVGIFQVRKLLKKEKIKGYIIAYLKHLNNSDDTDQIEIASGLDDNIKRIIKWKNVYNRLKELKYGWTQGQMDTLEHTIDFDGLEDLFQTAQTKKRPETYEDAYVKTFFSDPTIDKKLAFEVLMSPIYENNKDIIQTYCCQSLSPNDIEQINELNKWRNGYKIKQRNKAQNMKIFDPKEHMDNITKIFGRALSEKERMQYQINISQGGVCCNLPKDGDMYKSDEDNKHFTIKHVNGDGNCLYTGLAIKLTMFNLKNDGVVIEHHDVRNSIADHMTKNKKTYGDLCSLFDGNYIENVVKKPGAWGGILDIKAFSEIHQIIKIRVYDRDNVMKPFVFNENAKEHDIILLYSGKHYDLLEEEHNSESDSDEEFNHNFGQAGNPDNH